MQWFGLHFLHAHPEQLVCFQVYSVALFLGSLELARLSPLLLGQLFLLLLQLRNPKPLFMLGRYDHPWTMILCYTSSRCAFKLLWSLSFIITFPLLFCYPTFLSNFIGVFDVWYWFLLRYILLSYADLSRVGNALKIPLGLLEALGFANLNLLKGFFAHYAFWLNLTLMVRTLWYALILSLDILSFT